jgi:hypothetical protein
MIHKLPDTLVDEVERIARDLAGERDSFIGSAERLLVSGNNDDRDLSDFYALAAFTRHLFICHLENSIRGRS